MTWAISATSENMRDILILNFTRHGITYANMPALCVNIWCQPPADWCVAMGTLLKPAWLIYCLSLTAHDNINPMGNNHENLSKTVNKFLFFFAKNDMKMLFFILHERKKDLSRRETLFVLDH